MTASRPIGPRSPTPPAPSGSPPPVGGTGWFQSIVQAVSSLWQRFKLQIWPSSQILTPTLQDRVKEIKFSPHQSVNEQENLNFKKSFVGYLERVLSNSEEIKGLQHYFAQLSKVAEEIYQEQHVQEEFRREHLPILLAYLLTLPDERGGLVESTHFASLCPFTPHGRLTLRTDQYPAIYQRFQQVVSSQEGWGQWLVKSVVGRSIPEYFTVSLSDLRTYFNDLNQLRGFLEKEFGEILATPEGQQQAEGLLHIIAPPKVAVASGRQPSLTEALANVLVPRLVDGALKKLNQATESHDFQATFDTMMITLKDHLNLIHASEGYVDDVSHLIDEMKAFVLSREDLTDTNLERGAKRAGAAFYIWGTDLFAMPLEERRGFLETDKASLREKNYIKLARLEKLMQGRVFHRPSFQWAFDLVERGDAIPEDRREEMNKISLIHWGMPLSEFSCLDPWDQKAIFLESAYKAQFAQYMNEAIGNGVASTISDLVTPEMILDSLKELRGDGTGEAWRFLLQAFPLIENIIPQLESYLERRAPPEGELNFIPFVLEGIPLLFRGAVEMALDKGLIADKAQVSSVERLADETVLPTTIVSLHAVLLDGIIRKDMGNLSQTLLGIADEDAWKKEIITSYERLLKEEDLSLPPRFSPQEVLTTLLNKLRLNLAPVIDEIKTNYGTEAEQTKALEEALKLYLTAMPGEMYDLYAEMGLTAIFDLGGLPRIFRRIFGAIPRVGTTLSNLITSSIYSYRQGHRETIRKLTQVFEDMTKQLEGTLPIETRMPFEIRLPIAKDQIISPIPFHETQSLNGALERMGIGTKAKVENRKGTLVISGEIDKKWVEKNRKLPLSEVLRSFGLESILPKIDPRALENISLRQKLLAEKVAHLSRAAIVVGKSNLGVAGQKTLIGRMVKRLLPETAIKEGLGRVLHRVFTRDSAYNYRLIETVANLHLLRARML